MSIQELNLQLKNYFESKDFTYVDLPLVFDSDVFYEMSGEILRKQMYSFYDNSGKEKCLRPDLTIPVCHNYITNSQKFKSGKLCYSGPVFRSSTESEGSVELNQSGVEIIYEDNKNESQLINDIEIIQNALETLKNIGIEKINLRLGNLKYFMNFINVLNLPQRWKERLSRHYFRKDYFETLLARLSRGVGYDSQQRDKIIKEILGTETTNSEHLKKIIEEKNIFKSSRTTSEIIDRFNQKADMIIQKEDGLKIVELIREYQKINGNIDDYNQNLNKFIMDYDLNDFEDNTETLNKLNELCLSSKSVNEAIFLNNFRNTIEFYDGLIFEIFDTSGTYRLISGGRYDKLLKSLGSDEQLCAVGFATYNNEINKYLESKSNGQN